MARINIYTNDPEKTYVKTKPPGHVRKLIQADMKKDQRAEERRKARSGGEMTFP